MSRTPSPIETERRLFLKIVLAGVGAAILPSDVGSIARAASPDENNLGLGRDQDFSRAWLFHRGSGDRLEAAAADDSGWRTVDLPHDWSIEDLPGADSETKIGPFTKDAVGGVATGFTQEGEAWYRKHFRLGALPDGVRTEVYFGGIAVTCEVWLNGQKLAEHYHGYAPFACNLTPHLKRDGDNVLAVRSRNMGKNSRWYAGSGIYREVKLDVLSAGPRLARWGVAAWTRQITDQKAEIDITTQIEMAEPAFTLVSMLRSADGRIAGEIGSQAGAKVTQTLEVKSPSLWSPDEPYLYTLETELRRDGIVVDRMVQPYGIRIVTMDAAHGLQINGRTFKLRGGCIHHDNGLLGSVAFADADDRRVLLLKARGYNAIRSSHNPASATLRSACERLGMLLIEEAFDMWHVAKQKDDYSNYIKKDWLAALTAMVLSARNSPSVIMWSIGNEIPDRATPEGLEWCWKFANEVRRLDPTRPVTSGIHGVLNALVIPSEMTARAGFGGKPDHASVVFLDVPGFNYRLKYIEEDHKRFPDRVVYASETFPREAFDYQMLAERAPYMLGEFVWTAMDYLGEAGLGAVKRVPAGGARSHEQPTFPWINAWCGDIDLIGHQKPPSLFRDVVWGLSTIEIAVQRPLPPDQKEQIAGWGWSDELPSWTWPEAGAFPMNVRLYTSGDRVELRVNGQLVGERNLKAEDKMRAEIQVPYSAGTLEAIAWRNGKEIGRKRLETVSTPSKMRLNPEVSVQRADRLSLCYVGLEIVDEKGRVLPELAEEVTLAIDGPAELVAFGSACPFAVGSFQANVARTFRGRALAILRSTGTEGVVRIKAKANGLPVADASLYLCAV